MSRIVPGEARSCVVNVESPVRDGLTGYVDT
jgi:hypothetical protein